jgi:ceramide glucosyltransferase
VLIGRARQTVNPKLDNMEKGLAALTTDDILALDGNIDVPADLLDRLAARRDAKTGVVSANAVGSAPGSFGAEVECQFLNTLYARWLLTSDTFGGGYAIGKVFMLSRALLNSGGPDALATDVAEDAAATKLAWRFGLAVRQTDRPVDQPLGARSLGQVWSRMARWARLRRHSYPALYAIEWAMTPWVAAAAGGVVAGYHGIHVAWGLGAVLALWYATEATLARVAGWPWGPRAVLAAFVRDGMALAIWPLPFLSARYEWAGQAISLNGDTDPRSG